VRAGPKGDRRIALTRHLATAPLMCGHCHLGVLFSAANSLLICVNRLPSATVAPGVGNGRPFSGIMSALQRVACWRAKLAGQTSLSHRPGFTGDAPSGFAPALPFALMVCTWRLPMRRTRPSWPTSNPSRLERRFHEQSGHYQCMPTWHRRDEFPKPASSSFEALRMARIGFGHLLS